MKRSGLALVLVVGILAVLAVLGSAFAVLSRLERKAAVQRIHATRAWLLARSGVEDALARIASGQDPEGSVSRYAGENWDASSDGLLSGYEAEQEVYRKSGAGGRADIESCPVEQALRPSFFTRAGANPAVERIDGRDRGYTGRLTGGSYALRIRTGGFDVNGGDPASPPATGDFNENLRRMLGVLAEAIDREDGVDDGIPVDQADGLNLVDARPAVGWRSLNEIRERALGGSAEKTDTLEPYLILDAWRDLKVIRGNASASMAEVENGNWANIKMAHESYPDAPGIHTPDFERIPFSPSERVVGRAPVDLAWARRRRPALIALLAELNGIFVDHGIVWTGCAVFTRRAGIALDWALATDDCRSLAGQILMSDTPVRTWQDWDAFCDALTVSNDGLVPWYDDAWEGPRFQQAKRDLLKANFNPNSDLNKFNPDRSLARLMDKSDLLQGSTEFDLVSRGAFRVSSVGRVRDTSGRVLARRTVSCGRGGDEMTRLTAQREFVCENLGRLDLAGDESAPRAYSSAPYITPSAGTGRTFGHRLLGNPGASLQTYPDPHTVWTAPATGLPASYDGQIRLATLEEADAEHAPSAVSMLLQISWDRSMNGNFAGSGGNPNCAAISPSKPLWDNTTPGMLHPDGAYSEGRTGGFLRYRAPGNLLAHRGIVSFWVKPNYDESAYNRDHGGRGHMFFNNTRSPTGCFFLLHNLAQDLWYERCFAMFYESDGVIDENYEQMGVTPNGRSVPAHRWMLLTWFWNMNSVDPNLSRCIRVNRGDNDMDKNNAEYYSTVMDPPTIDFRYQPQGSLTPAVFALGDYGNGTSGGRVMNNKAPADSTYDEFLSLDFSASAAEAKPRVEAMAQDRYAEGRYYKESDYFGLGQAGNKAGQWFSAPLDLGGEKRVVRLVWTQIVPGDLRAPASPGGTPEDSDPGDAGRIAFEFADAAGTGYKVPGFHTRSEGSDVDRKVSGPFRLHAVFQPRIQDMNNKAILDSITLDDVSIVYRDPAAPLFRVWSEGR